MRTVLALDQGSHASRAVLFDRHGTLLASSKIAIAVHRGSNGEVEHDAGELADSLRQATAQLLTQVPAAQIEATALATQRSTVVCFDRRDAAPLSAALSWQDRRNADWLQGFAAHTDLIRARTGLPLSPHYGAAKMRWCLDHLPTVQAAARAGTLCVGPLSAFLVSSLTGGRPLADPANASRTLLWDSARLDWCDKLLQLFGIQRSWLPQCASSRADYGELRIAGRQLRLTAVTGDQSAVPFAAGLPDPGTAYINLGTGAFIQRPLHQRPADPAPLLGSVLASLPEPLYSLEGTVNGAGSAVSWYVTQNNLDEATLWPALEQLPQTAALPLLVNGVGGLGSPWWRAAQPTHFIGAGNTLECFAAVIDSIVLLIAVNFRLLSQAAPPLTRVLVAGGISRSDWLCRRLAAALGVPVQRLDSEASARGAAALAAPELAASWQASLQECFEPEFIQEVAERGHRLQQLLDQP